MRRILAWLGGATLVLGGLALALACVDQAIVAENSDRPQVVLKWRPDYPDALARAADDEARAARSGSQWNAATRLAARALAANPMDTRALRVLAWAAARDGRNDKADAIMQVAGSLTERDSRINGWLLNSALEHRDWPRAFSRADALMRTDPDLAPSLYPVIISALQDPSARVALAERLAWRPDWRGDLLAASANSADLASVQSLFDAVDAGPAPLTASERGALIDGLLAHKAFTAARSEWGRLLLASARRPDLLYDGDFRGLPGGPPFNWIFLDNRNAVSELGAAPGGEPALHLQYQEAHAALLVQQVLALPAGGYRFSGVVQFDHVGPNEELAWRIVCVGGAPLAEGRLTPDHAGWRAFSLDFKTPASQCPAQQLSLSSLAQENFGVLQAWLRGLSILPTTANSPTR